MNKIKRVTAALMAAFVIVITTYNTYTFEVHATGVAEVVLGDYLIDIILTYMVMYMGYDVLSSDDIEQDIFAFLNTPEGYNLLLDLQVKETSSGKSFSLAEHFGLDHLVDNGGSPPNPDPKNIENILNLAIAGLVFDQACKNFAAVFFNHEQAIDSAVGAAINEASNQQVIYFPFPEYMHFTSVTERMYDDLMDVRFKSFYPEYDPANSYYVQNRSGQLGQFYYIILVSEDLESVGISSLSLIQNVKDNDYNFIAYDFEGNKVNLRRYYTYTPNSNNHSVQYGNNLSVGGYIEDLYICGDMDIYMGRNSEEHYHLYPDGSVVQVLDGQNQEVIPYISTAEGYLTSVKPIVKMDISSLVDAIGKAIVDSYPDEVPVLSQDAINQIYNNVSNVYDDAITNYYNDTRYIDQSQYITNVTNVFNEAIADNPVIDLPATDTGVLSAIKAIPKQIANVLKDIFVPDLALYSYYFLDIKSQFAFLDNFFDFGSNLIIILFDSDPEIPKIVIDFGLAESKYDYGGRTYALDMTFYARFKPMVDNIIVSFSWLAFGYWVYKNLPEIISGTILSRKDYAVVKETGNTIFSKGGTFGSFSKERVKEIRDIDKIKIEKDNKK